jgi:hypothetical protein
MPKKNDPYTKLLGDIHTQLRKQNSMGFSFLQGLLRGFGTALGATVILALVTSIALEFADSEAVTSFMTAVIRALAGG